MRPLRAEIMHGNGIMLADERQEKITKRPWHIFVFVFKILGSPYVKLWVF